MGMQNDLEECEKVVGQWNPHNKFRNIYETLDSVHDEIDEFNTINEDSKISPTPTNSAMPVQTPGGSRRGTISAKAKWFNQDLQTLEQKFRAMEDVTYDQQKVVLVFEFTERALEQKAHLDIIYERL